MEVGLKTKWVEALRSGEYEQCTGALRLPSSTRPGEFAHCVLGVLCDVNGGDDYTYDQLDQLLGRGIGFADHVWHMNDVNGMKFPELADWIEENL